MPTPAVPLAAPPLEFDPVPGEAALAPAVLPTGEGADVPPATPGNPPLETPDDIIPVAVGFDGSPTPGSAAAPSAAADSTQWPCTFVVPNGQLTSSHALAKADRHIKEKQTRDRPKNLATETLDI